MDPQKWEGPGKDVLPSISSEADFGQYPVSHLGDDHKAIPRAREQEAVRLKQISNQPTTS
ncbi:hypothetical protein VE04_02803, partial [Pseudogymnoascus sp. 24MN13]